jgi:RHS repeat-associated protein
MSIMVSGTCANHGFTCAAGRHSYDALRRMTAVTNPWGETTYYTYSPGGRMTSRVLGNGCVTYFSYAQGQLARVENLHDDLSPISTFEYERDVVGNPLSILREDGYVTYYDYDAKYQLAAETQVDPYGATLYAWTWDYDLAGNRLAQTFNGAATYYEYNEANELLTETTDGATTYYEYDHRGNQTVKQEPAGTTYYEYNPQNLLTRIVLPDETENTFGYDGDSKRVWANDSVGARHFVYQGPNMLALLQERDDSGERLAQYTMGQGLESQNRNGVSSFYLYDALGSTIALTDINENITDTYRYNAWGEILDRTGITQNPHTYVGKERYYAVLDTFLYLLGLRYYGPSLARFITVDPARIEINWYAYASAYPTSTADASGLSGSSVCYPCHVHRWYWSIPTPSMDVQPCERVYLGNGLGWTWYDFLANWLPRDHWWSPHRGNMVMSAAVDVEVLGHENCAVEQWLESWDKDHWLGGPQAHPWQHTPWQPDKSIISGKPGPIGGYWRINISDAPQSACSGLSLPASGSAPQAGAWTQFGIFVRDKSTGQFVGDAKYWWIYYAAFSTAPPPQGFVCKAGLGSNPYPIP